MVHLFRLTLVVEVHLEAHVVQDGEEELVEVDAGAVQDFVLGVEVVVILYRFLNRKMLRTLLKKHILPKVVRLLTASKRQIQYIHHEPLGFLLHFSILSLFNQVLNKVYDLLILAPRTILILLLSTSLVHPLPPGPLAQLALPSLLRGSSHGLELFLQALTL